MDLFDADTLESLRDMAMEKKRKVFVPAGALWGATDIQKMADRGTLKVSAQGEC